MRKIKIELCAGTSCHVMGSGEIMAVISGLDASQRTHIQLKLTHCLGACAKGPSMKVDGQLYTNLTPEQTRILIGELLQSQ